MSEEPKWAQILIKTAGKLGFSEVKMRWRLQKYMDKSSSTDDNSNTARRNFVNCYHCRALQSPGDKICYQCGKPVTPSVGESLRDTVGGIGGNLNAPMMLMLLFVVAYLRVMISSPSASFWSLRGDVLFVHGAVFGEAIVGFNQWWRLLSAAYLHGGIMHIGFNIYALMIIGPKVEEILGRGRTLLLFAVTAIFGFLATTVFTGHLSVGASGGIMGFLGFAAAWGHKDGTPYGIEIRNLMVQWFIFVTIFGLLLNTDHAAHFGGFISGGILGFVVTPSRELKIKKERIYESVSMGLWLVATGYVFVRILFPSLNL